MRAGQDDLQLSQGHFDVNAMLRGVDRVRTSNRLLLDVLGLRLLALSDDAFHAIRHLGVYCGRDACRRGGNGGW